jgi:hypothetical protein
LQQSTFSFYKSRVSINRPGLKAGKNLTKLTPVFTTALTTRKLYCRVGEVNKVQVIKVFQNLYTYTAAGEPNSDNKDKYKSDNNYRPRVYSKQNIYSWEKKFLAIVYFEQTDIPGKVEETWVLISESQASKKLKID